MRLDHPLAPLLELGRGKGLSNAWGRRSAAVAVRSATAEAMAVAWEVRRDVTNGRVSERAGSSPSSISPLSESDALEWGILDRTDVLGSLQSMSLFSSSFTAGGLVVALQPDRRPRAIRQESGRA